ncbi:dienelactone hydrolase family protein [Microbacterium sp. C7(2022)]|uniref:dienelactone hydrolase family protein n=1 Tax=Microbacterium sp. C7(2022) TaxID=2992759 RepID=UPI00237BF6EC|nr:dienelactone hydrolase family protein [Microbacterium sp. C7(2022)]MDE0545206.1 dienelactone hydrolase family protein [Microbacterium sp. C7(2022)]
MADILLFHHIQGLTAGVQEFADDLRRAGHTVHVPDLFDGRTFGSIEEGFAYAQDAGFETLRERGVAAADGLGADLVYTGFSFGVMIAQQLAQNRPGARGALLLHSCIPLAEFGGVWPAEVPVQIHGMEGDEFFDEDLPAARDLVAVAADAELFVYPGDKHLFTDSSLDAYDPEAAALVRERVHGFLGRL